MTDETRIIQILADLGLPTSYAMERRLRLQPECEPDDLVSIGLDLYGREQQMESLAAAQWHVMVSAATSEGVTLQAVSAFRSYDYQRGIIARKLAAGQTLDQILRVSALPGFSEHHTGRAIDIGTPGSKPLEEEFEHTLAFGWLQRRAHAFGFTLSYPRDNTAGVIYEPWHWLFA